MLSSTGHGDSPKCPKGLPSRLPLIPGMGGKRPTAEDSGLSYLEAGTVIRKRRVEEAAHDVHD